MEIKGLNQMQQLQTIKPEIKEIEREVIKEIKVVPSYQPNYVCKGDKCKIKKNPNYKERVKGKCPECGQWSKFDNGPCQWNPEHGQVEPLDDDELDSLGIDKPQEKESDIQEEAD